jgi:hypothetical protein
VVRRTDDGWRFAYVPQWFVDVVPGGQLNG